MTAAQIRAMDHDALTCLAFRHGLAPASTVRHSDGTYWCEEGPQRQWASWRPWEVLVQATAVFMALRPLGWTTRIEGRRHRGCVWADHGGGLDGVMVTWPSPHAETEAMALLRAACLAMGSAQGVPHA